jgi:hypothetical protein
LDLALVAKAAQKKYTGADRCKDLHGRRHDIVELREKRNKATLRGMKYAGATHLIAGGLLVVILPDVPVCLLRFMAKFLKKNNFKALYSIGDDVSHTLTPFFACHG